MVAGEISGDLLGGGLISELTRRFPDAAYFGIGGPRMQAAGFDVLYEMDRIELIGLGGLFDKLADILKVRTSLYQIIVKEKPDIFIGIDVPDFNIGLEKKLRKKGILTVHYVSPTVWAWRGYRIHKIRKAVDLMLTLFPFEKRYYQENNIPVTCVGHPIADEIPDSDRVRARKALDLDLNDTDILIAVLPGSRGSEVSSLGPVFVETMRKVHCRYPQLRFVLPFANSRVRKIFLKQAGSMDGLPVELMDGNSRLAMEASNLVLLASGTAALEAVLLERPHVVAYKLSPVTWWFFRFLRHVNYYSMSNQLLSKPVVPELMQDDATADNIFKALNGYLENPERGLDLESEFRRIRGQLKLNANVQAAKAISELLNHRNG